MGRVLGARRDVDRWLPRRAGARAALGRLALIPFRKLLHRSPVKVAVPATNRAGLRLPGGWAVGGALERWWASSSGQHVETCTGGRRGCVRAWRRRLDGPADESGVRYFPSIQKLASKARRPNRVAYRTHPAPASRRRSASAASHTARSSHSPSAVARCRAHPRLPAFPLCRLCTGLRRSAGGGICARVPNHAPTRPPARSHAALSSPRPSAPRALALTPGSPPSVAQTVHCGTAHCRWCYLCTRRPSTADPASARGRACVHVCLRVQR